MNPCLSHKPISIIIRDIDLVVDRFEEVIAFDPTFYYKILRDESGELFYAILVIFLSYLKK